MVHKVHTERRGQKHTTVWQTQLWGDNPLRETISID